MAIASGDIEFLASATMTDDDEGGGAPSATVIQDGVSNAIFPDIAEVDRAGGSFRLRKLFLAVNTATTDTLYGANVILSEVPTDPNVSVTMLAAEDYFEERGDTVERVEAYLYQGGLFAGYLVETHLKGMQTLQIAQRPGASLPAVGETLYLVQNEGATNEFGQYVRVKSVSSTQETYTVEVNGAFVDFQVQMLTVTMTATLAYTFTGSAVNRLFQTESAAAKVRKTIVANATKYYGASGTTEAVAIGSKACKVESVYSRLVPAAQSETALTDKSLTGTTSPVVPAASSTVSRSVSISRIAPGGTYTLPTACCPGTLKLVTPYGTYTDDGTGNLLMNGASAGSIDYGTGTLTLSIATAGDCTEVYQPAGAASQSSYTDAVVVTAANRSLVWVKSLVPIPVPGALTVSYMAGGNWYSLSDDGTGRVAASDSSYGVGKLSFTTGSLALTLGALPDVGTSIIYTWGTAAESVMLTNDELSIATPKIEFDAGTALSRGTVKLTWKSGGVAKTATDNGNGGFAGDATGAIYYGTGTGNFVPAALPDSGLVSLTFEAGSTQTLGTAVSGGTTWTGSLGSAPIKPGSVTASLLLQWAKADSDSDGNTAVSGGLTAGTVYDDGDGGLILAGYGALPGASIDYTTGAVVLVINYSSTVPVAVYSTVQSGSTMTVSRRVISGYSVDTTSRQIGAGGITWKWRLASDTDAAGSASLAAPVLTLDLQPYLAGTIVAGSLRFRVGSYDYVERDGRLYHSINPATGAGTEAGTIEYASGKATITEWSSGTFSFTLLSGLIIPGGTGMDAVFGRTADAPLKTESFEISATALDGTAISATAAGDGTISGTNVTGSIDYETGIYTLSFGATVAGTWESKLVSPSSMRYNCVAYSYLPLDASIIGIDPVRLPTDGRVQIFTAGDYAVLGHTKSVSQAVAAGQTVNLGRTRLSRVWIVGQDGKKISTGYTADLDAGTVSFTDVTGYAQPVTIYDRIEDMAMISDAQISGDIAFTRQISHAYPVGSMLSSALVLGDQYAHVKNLFDQATWDGATWSDTLSGNSATASYDKTTYPLVVTNAGAVTERWCLRFTNTTTFQVIGEHLGILGTGNTGADTLVPNPNSTEPYFTLKAAGWGQGWAAGNCLFFQTISAKPPIWLAETIQQGAEVETDHSLTLIARGDVDAE
jgi:hypothetical protein